MTVKYSFICQGYVKERIACHPLFPKWKVTVLQHRRVMAEKLGRPLLETEMVHHINGNTLDNSPDNLEILSMSAHAKIHLKSRNSTGQFSKEAINAGR